MPFLDAISSGQKDSLRGTSLIAARYASAVYMSLVPNDNVYTARINQSTFTSPLAELTYDGGSGTLANVKVGMTVLISETDDRTKAYWRGRIRAAPTATILYINETSGEGFDDDDYIYIIDDYDVWDKLPRLDGSGNVLPDWDTTFRQLLPLIYDLKSAYADWVSSDTGDELEIAFAPQTVAMADGAAISTYLWDIDDGSYESGTSASQNITARFPAGFRWISLTVTDDNSNSLTRHIPVWAHDPDSYAPNLVEIGQINVTAAIGEGYNAQVDAFDGVDAVLDYTLCCAWCQEWYNGTEGSLIDNIAMVGRFRNEQNVTEFTDEGQREAAVSFEIEGVLTRLAALEISPIYIEHNTAPDEWFEVDDLTIQRAIWLLVTELSTFAELHSLQFFATNEDYRYPGFNTQGGDIYSSVADLAQSFNAIFQMNAAGECEVVRNGVLMTADADRNALTTVLDITNQDYTGIEVAEDYFEPIGLLTGDGGVYSTSADSVSPYLLRAPAGAPGAGSSNMGFARQITKSDLTKANARIELEGRAGHALAANQPRETIGLTFKDGYWFFIPAVDQWYTFTLAGTETVRGVTLTTATRWQLLEMSILHNGELGTKEITGVFAIETTGAPGQSIVPPVLETGDYPDGLDDDIFEDGGFIDTEVSFDTDVEFDFEFDDGDFTFDQGTWSDGTGVESECTGSDEWIDMSRDFEETKTLTSITVTYDADYKGGASNANFIQTRVSGGPWITRDQWTTSSGSGNTRSVSLANVLADGIRVVMYAGIGDCTGYVTITNLVFSEITGESDRWTHTFDFTANDGGFVADLQGSYSAGNGWDTSDDIIATIGRRAINIKRSISPTTTITDITMTFDYTKGNVDGPGTGAWVIEIPDGDRVVEISFNGTSDGDDRTTTWSGGSDAEDFRLIVNASRDNAAPYIYGGAALLTKCVVSGTGDNPFD